MQTKGCGRNKRTKWTDKSQNLCFLRISLSFFYYRWGNNRDECHLVLEEARYSKRIGYSVGVPCLPANKPKRSQELEERLSSFIVIIIWGFRPTYLLFFLLPLHPGARLRLLLFCFRAHRAWAQRGALNVRMCIGAQIKWCSRSESRRGEEGEREREREPQQQDRHSDCATRQNYRPTTCYLYGVKKEKESFRHFFISLRSLSPSLSLPPSLSLSFFLSFALFVIPLLLFIFPHKNVTVPIVDNVISSVCSHFTLKKKKKKIRIFI